MTRALLASLTITSWWARKYDRAISAEIAVSHNASFTAGRYNKCLLPASAESYRKLAAVIADCRRKHYEETLAWSDDGQRLLPQANYLHYTAEVRKLRAGFDSALEAFLAEYPALKDAAKAALNGMYSEADYPGVARLRTKYSFSVDFSPLPDSRDFRLSLARDEMDAIARDTTRRVTEALRAAQADAVDRLLRSVEHVSERLADPKAVFRDSLIGNALEVCDALSRLNLAEDTRLERLRRRFEAIVRAADPQTLREDPDARKQTAAETANILHAMRGLYGREVAA